MALRVLIIPFFLHTVNGLDGLLPPHSYDILPAPSDSMTPWFLDSQTMKSERFVPVFVPSDEDHLLEIPRYPVLIHRPVQDRIGSRSAFLSSGLGLFNRYSPNKLHVQQPDEQHDLPRYPQSRVLFDFLRFRHPLSIVPEFTTAAPTTTTTRIPYGEVGDPYFRPVYARPPPPPPSFFKSQLAVPSRNREPVELTSTTQAPLPTLPTSTALPQTSTSSAVSNTPRLEARVLLVDSGRLASTTLATIPTTTAPSTITESRTRQKETSTEATTVTSAPLASLESTAAVKAVLTMRPLIQLTTRLNITAPSDDSRFEQTENVLLKDLVSRAFNSVKISDHPEPAANEEVEVKKTDPTSIGLDMTSPMALTTSTTSESTTSTTVVPTTSPVSTFNGSVISAPANEVNINNTTTKQPGTFAVFKAKEMPVNRQVKMLQLQTKPRRTSLMDLAMPRGSLRF